MAEIKKDIDLLERAFKYEFDKKKSKEDPPKKIQSTKPKKRPSPEIGELRGAEIERLLDKDLLLAEKARRNLRVFIEQAWHTVEPASPFVGNWHIDAMADHLKALRYNQIKNLLINIPPRTSKSSVCSVFYPAWIWATDPWFRFIYTSYALHLSHDHARKFRTLVDSRWYRKHFGHKFHLISNTIGRVANNESGYRLVVSPTSGTGIGGDLIAADDPNSAKDAWSEVTREAVNTHWSGVLANRFEGDPKLGRRLIVQQRLNDNDLSGHVLKEGGWTLLRLPMEYVSTKKCQVYIDGELFFEDPRTHDGEPLDKNRYDQEWVDIHKGTNVSGKNPELERKYSPYVWSGQYQQDPVPEGGGILKSKWFERSFYKDPPEEIYKNCHKIIQICDMSFKEANDSSYVVCQVWGKLNADIYLIHETRARMGFVDTLEAFRKVCRDFPASQEKLVERRANGDAIIDTLKGKIPGIIPIEPGNESKVDRAEAISWMVEAGNVRLPDPDLYPWVEAVLLELVRFPVGDHDDRVDALTQAAKRFMTFMIQEGAPHPTGVSDGQSWRSRDWSVRGGSPYSGTSPFTRKWSY